MKKSLALVLMTGFLLTGCGGKTAQMAETPPVSAIPVVASGINVPNVVGRRLDEATDELKGLGLKVVATDTLNEKTIVRKLNWQVSSQDVAPGATVAESSEIKLGVLHLTDETATPSPTPTLETFVEAPAAEVAPPVVVPAAPVAPAPVPAVPAAAVPAPSAYYANCAAVRAAGAAPLHAGQPGYSTKLDRDRDGVACE